MSQTAGGNDDANLNASSQVAQPFAAQGAQLSPDGRYWWDGKQWLSVAQQTSQPQATQPPRPQPYHPGAQPSYPQAQPYYRQAQPTSSGPRGVMVAGLLQGWNPIRQPSPILGVLSVLLIPVGFWSPVSPVIGFLGVLLGISGLRNGLVRGIFRGFRFGSMIYSTIGVGLSLIGLLAGGALYFAAPH